MNIPTGINALTGNEAAAVAAILARVESVSAYPITPQTLLIEYLAKYFAEDKDKRIKFFENLESEHSMLAHAIAMSHQGVRAFTATSSQGFLYAVEQFHLAGRTRVPLVMAVVNRSLSNPWNIKTDLNDGMTGRDCGWLQFYCANQQEVFDTTLLAYKISEQVLLPAMVCYEGFIVSHAAARVDVSTQKQADNFLPPFSPDQNWVLDFNKARSYFQISDPEMYMRHHFEIEIAMRLAKTLIEAEAQNFSKIFGREKTGLIEICGNPQAKTALVTIGSIGDTAKILAEEKDILLVRIHSFRPFPYAALSGALADAERVAVVDRACSFGAMPPLAAETMAALGKKNVHSFVAGLGGVDVTEKTLEKIVDLCAGPVSGESVWMQEGGE
ncbi:MAG: pyruvate ferredoxin oxidoreductase [bacterium]|nr:pyruvate ferredoxin oxidoreductase [bacterium]